MPRRPDAVLGIGNVLMSDDGFGPAVIAALRAGGDLPPGVEALELGTPGLDLAEHLAGRERVILVDTVILPEPPGSVWVLEESELLGGAGAPRATAHQPALAESVTRCRLAGAGPRLLCLVGAVPARLAPGTTLSPEVRRAVPLACRRVTERLAATAGGTAS